MSRDHITDELLGPGAQFVELDRGVQEMDFDFCRTLQEITARLGMPAASERPVFAHTRSLNLHLARVRHGSVPQGESYPGLLAPYASRVFHMDACFGRFVDFLKAHRLYDQSLIVVTADHGERMGEDGQWGHSYHMTPEVIQIPLLLHLPADVRWEHVDQDAVALSTDIVPTIYDALGIPMPGIEGLRGRSLVGPAHLAEHARRDDIVLAASYGAVYATLRHNGRSLYIRDAINSREQAYERAGSTWSAVPITRDMRAINDLRIRQHVDRLARAYHVEARF
jgi:arylsulfatase A-like enzyme